MTWLAWAARAAVVAIAMAAAAFVAWGTYPMGLDFEGGAHLVLRPASAIEPVRAWLDRERLDRVSVIARGDDLVVELPDVDAARVDRLLAGLGAAPRFAIAGGIGPEHVARVEVTDRAVRLTLTAEGGRRFADLTAERLGQTLPVRLGDEVLIEPVVQDVIRGGQVEIATAGEDPRALAGRIRAGLVPPVTVEHVTVIEPTRDPRLGRPLGVAVALAAAVAWALWLVTRRPVVAAPAALLLVWAATTAWVLGAGGTFTLAVHLQGILLGAPAALTAVLAARRGWRAAWPGGIAFVAVVSLAGALDETFAPGPVRGALRTVEHTAGPALVVLALAVAAVACSPACTPSTTSSSRRTSTSSSPS